MSPGAPVLELRDVFKSFGEAEIICGVTLDLRGSERHAVIGPNGAGKSTLFHLISGRYAPTKGDILLKGQAIGGLPPHVINRRGLARSFQITSIFPRLSVFENLRVAVMRRHGRAYDLFRPVSRARRIREETDHLLERVRLAPRRDTMGGDLSYSEQRALEVGMTLACDPEVLLLDEPMAGMSREETDHAVELIKEVTRGKSLLIVEHDMQVVFSLADRITVLVYGEVLASGTPDEIRANPKVREAYLGEEMAA
jgi:branched-chain amino acid transport system ATP-binding protein